MNKFKEVFRFLDEYGGTSFIADINKENYNKERYRNITDLKTKAYDEFWKKLFSNLEQYINDKDKKQQYRIQQWQNSGNIYDYFWIQIKDKEKIDYASSISIVAEKEAICVKVEYQFTSKNNINPVINHNKYLLSLDKWIEDYNIKLNQYSIYYEIKDKEEKIGLSDFIKKYDLRAMLEEKVKNNEEFRLVIQKEFNKHYVLSSKNFEFEIAQSINELNFLYEKSTEDNSTLEKMAKKFIKIIKNQKMSKSYKIALLSSFINGEIMLSTVTYEKIYETLKNTTLYQIIETI